jgi:hypothetical protein
MVFHVERLNWECIQQKRNAAVIAAILVIPNVENKSIVGIAIEKIRLQNTNAHVLGIAMRFNVFSL